VIVLTWVYDITPEGIKVTRDLESKTEDEIKETEKQITVSETDESVRTGAGESELQKKVSALEDQLKEARNATMRSMWPVFIKKIGVPVLIAILVIAIVLNKERIAGAFGSGNEKRETARLHNAYATAYIESSDLESARREVELALESDPEYSNAWSNLGVITYREGDLDMAINQTIKAVTLDPKNSRAPYNLAFALDDNKDYNQAIRWYRKAISIDSAYNADTVFTAASSALGRLYNSFGQQVEATVILIRAMEMFPGSKYIPYVYKNLGNSYLLRQQTDSALKYLELSDRLLPSQPETNLFLAKAYEASGQFSKSLDKWQDYIDLETDTAKISEARKHLKELAIVRLKEITNQ
jgi:tetratricopeptide (TPR) repeat protein